MNATIAPLPTPDDVIAAATRLADVAIKTPVLTNRALDQRLGGTGWLKPEILQHTGSFKFRGAYNRLVQLTAQQRKAGVVAFSSGNHAQGVALAGQMLDMPVTIVMPDVEPSALAALAFSVPPETVVAPVKVLLPERIHLPESALITLVVEVPLESMMAP